MLHDLWAHPTFSSHRSRNHKNCTPKDFQTIASPNTEDEANDGEHSDSEAGTSQISVIPDEDEEIVEGVDSETLQHKLAFSNSFCICSVTCLERYNTKHCRRIA